MSLKCNKVKKNILQGYFYCFFSGCHSDQWKCLSKDKCIPNAQRCDREFLDCCSEGTTTFDCDDRSDEEFCDQEGANLSLKKRPFDQM